jgi:hypothetical protein
VEAEEEEKSIGELLSSVDWKGDEFLEKESARGDEETIIGSILTNEIGWAFYRLKIESDEGQ